MIVARPSRRASPHPRPLFGAIEMVRAEADRLLEEAFVSSEINHREYRVLATIGECPGLLQRDVAARAGIDRSSIVMIMRRLLDLGLAEYRPASCPRGSGHAYYTTGRGVRRLDALAKSLEARERRFIEWLQTF